MAELDLDRMLKRRKLSKRQFAIRLNKPYFSVFRFFRKGYNPTLETLNEMAKALNCKVRDLLKE